MVETSSITRGGCLLYLSDSRLLNFKFSKALVFVRKIAKLTNASQINAINTSHYISMWTLYMAYYINNIIHLHLFGQNMLLHSMGIHSKMDLNQVSSYNAYNQQL